MNLLHCEQGPLCFEYDGTRAELKLRFEAIVNAGFIYQTIHQEPWSMGEYWVTGIYVNPQTKEKASVEICCHPDNADLCYKSLLELSLAPFPWEE